MNKKNTLIFLFFLSLIFLVIYFFYYYQIKITLKKDPLKPQIKINKKCGIENCHGLDITCGPNIAKVCPMIYKISDGCRRFVSCQIINNQCQIKKSPKFEACKACVERCQQNFSNNDQLFNCESQCIK